MKSPNNTRWRITIDDNGILQRVALSLIAFFCLAVSGFAQSVSDMVTDTNGTIRTGRTNTLVFTNPVTWATNVVSATRTNLGLGAPWLTDTNISQYQFNFGGVGGVLEVEANNTHAIVARASDATDGAAFYGWSASGAPAGKFVQTNAYTSPALSVWRTAGDYASDSPALLVHGEPSEPTVKALSVKNGTNEVYSIDFNGNTSDHHWLGNATNDPASPKEGQMYFNTNDSTVRIFANGQWRTLN